MLAPLAALVLALAAPASPLDAPAQARQRTPGLGRVVQVTGARAYLDAGEEDGLSPGQVLTLLRGDVETGRCTVDAVAPSHATCTGGGPRPGDGFRLAPRAAAPVAAAVRLPPVPADAELARRAEVVAAEPVAQVVDKASAPPPRPALPRAALGEVALVGAVWDTSAGGPYEVARIDAALHGAPAGPVVIDLDLRAERWVKQFKPTFRPDDRSRFYLWQAQAGWYPADRPIAVDAGRVLAFSVPGATVMDGAIVGRRGDGWQASVFGGLVPEPDTLAPTTSRATAGGAWVLEQRSRDGFLFRQEGRLAWVRSPELGDRAELEAAASLQSKSALELRADARLGVGGTEHAPGYLDGARLELGVRPVPKLSLTAGFDYGGLLQPQPVVTAFYPGRTRHADASGFYDLGGWRLGVVAGHATDAVSSLDRTWVGPEVQVPRFLTPRVALSAGYLEELGWLHGRSAFLQTVARPWDRLRLIGRISWTDEESLGLAQQELGGLLSAVAELTDRLGLRLSVLVRTVLPTGNEFGSNPSGVNANASLYALF